MRRSLAFRILICAALVCSVVVIAPVGAGAVMVSPWRWQNPLPQGDTLNDVAWISGTDTVWTVGNSGLIMKSTDAATSWTKVNSGVSCDLSAVGFADSTHGWIIGALDTSTGVILKTNDGINWSPQTLPLGIDAATHGVSDISVVDATHAYAVGYNGYIIKTTDGANWVATGDRPDIGMYTAVDFVDAAHGYVATETGFWYTTDGGDHWTDLTLTGFHITDIAFTDATHGWIVGIDDSNTNRIFYTQNLANWANVPLGITAQGTGMGVCFADVDNGWVVTGAGQVWHTTDGHLGNASHWTSASPYGVWVRTGNAISFGSTAKGAFVGSAGAIGRTTNGGTNWATRTNVSDDPVFGIDFLSASTGYAIATSDVLKSTDGGRSWTRKVTGSYDTLKALDFVDTQTGYAVGMPGVILKTTSGGETWSTQGSAGGALDLRAVSAVDANHAWICDGVGKIQATSNGADWAQQFASPTTHALASIDFFDATHGIAVGDFGETYWTADGGLHWYAGVSGTTDHLTSVQMVTATKGYAVGWWGSDPAGHAAIIVTTDGGAHWDPTGGSSPQPYAYLYAVSFSSEMEGWAVGFPGAIIHTTDGGMNWSKETICWESIYSVSSVPGTSKAWAGGYGGIILTNTSVPAKKIVYRFYNPKTGTHLYTADVNEKDNIIKNLSTTYDFEGVCYQYDESQAEAPLVRFYRPSTNTYLYSADPDEIERVKTTLQSTYTLEGPVYRVSSLGGQPVWRFYNARKGTHFYTADETEKDTVIANLGGTYDYEGIAFYLPQ